jgi:tripartite-type tricarboxylate transporter receptor subunit TctC
MTAFVKRRKLLLGFAKLPVASRIADAETYSSRPVRILVVTSAGGGTDR